MVQNIPGCLAYNLLVGLQGHGHLNIPYKYKDWKQRFHSKSNYGFLFDKWVRYSEVGQNPHRNRECDGLTLRVVQLDRA